MDRVLALVLVAVGFFLLGKYFPEPKDPKAEIDGFDLKLGPVTEQKAEE
jgi:hypothetical protein